MKLLKQSTAATVVVGPFVAFDDGVTPKDGLTSQTGRITKNGTGGGLTPSSWTHDWEGHFLVGLSTSHTDTLGRLRIAFADEGVYVPVWEDFMVVPAQVYDSLVGGTDLLQVDATQIEGADATDTINAQADQALADYDPPTKAEMDAGFAALNDLSAAEVNAEVDQALADIHLDHLLATTYDPASKPGAADALLNELVENDGGVSRFTANALEQAPTGGSAPSAADIADAVWEEAVADHSGTAGSTAEALAAAGGAGDPWITTLPGSYTGSQAGKVLADVLADTADIAAIKAKTDALPTDPADQSAVEAAITAATSPLATAAALATVDTVVDAILADTGTDGVVLSAAQMNAIADHVRRRTQANVEASSDGDALSLDSLYGLIQAVLESAISGGVLTVKKTDGSTTLGTKNVATDAGADPITGVS